MEQRSSTTFRQDPLSCLNKALAADQADAVWVDPHELCLGDPAAAREVLANSDGHFEDHSDFFHTRRGQFGTRDEQVALRRHTQRFLHAYLNAHADELRNQINNAIAAESTWPDAGNWLAYRYLVDALIQPAREPDLRPIMDEIVEHTVLAGSRERRPLWRRMILRYRVARAFAQAIDTRRRENVDHPSDLLDVVIMCTGREHTADELAELFLSYIFAVAGSLGFALGWAVYMFGTRSRNDTSDIHADWIVREALRLWPVAWFLSRQSTQKRVVSGESITTEDSVNVCPYMVHRHPNFWSEPDAFRPERWAEPASQKSTAYIPFGFGRHRCVAASLSLDLVSRMFHFLVADHELEIVSGDGKPQVGPALAPPRFTLKRSPRVRSCSQSPIDPSPAPTADTRE